MDPVINSLVQSPLVRSMSTVPSKSASFVHGVKDNVPPFSFQKVVVQPWNNPSTTTQEQSHKFRIPQFGTLNRAYLRVKTVNQVPLAGGVAGGPIIEEGDYDTLHVINSDTASVNSDYTALNNQVRFPWIHKNQVGGLPAQKQCPFGYGGSISVNQASTINPQSTGAVATNADNTFAASNILSDPEAFRGDSSNSWNVINILDEIRLTTNGKLIETVYGETIPAEVVKMPPQLRDFYLKGMAGWACGNDDGAVLSEPNYEEPWDPSACLRDAYGRYMTDGNLINANATCTAVLRNQHANFIVPVTLSSLKSLPKNYQTRFVEDLELEVKMKELARGFNTYALATDLTKHHEVELVLIYHNWHDNIENTIRNSNYKRGVPASIYSTNWVRAATTTAAVSNTLPLSIPLTSRNLVTELVVVARSKKASSVFATVDRLNVSKSDYRLFLDKEFTYSLELLGSGKTIWSSTNKELHGPDTADYDLVERKMHGGDSAYSGVASQKLVVGTHNNGGGFKTAGTNVTINPRSISQAGVDYSFNDNMAIMRFGFQTTDEFYSGGIALQTISNPTIKITPPAALSGDTWTDVELEFDVYVKHSNLVRIDSDTGAVTRTLDV